MEPMTLRTIEERFARLLALHDLVFEIEQNKQGELEFLADNHTLNIFVDDCKKHMETEGLAISQALAMQAAQGALPELQSLLDSIKLMANGEYTPYTSDRDGEYDAS